MQYLVINEWGGIWRIKQIEEGVCYNTLQNLPNSSYPMKAEFINCFIIHSK